MHHRDPGLLHRCGGERGKTDDVADRVDMRHRGLVTVVNVEQSAFGGGETSDREVEFVRVSAAAGGDENVLALREGNTVRVVDAFQDRDTMAAVLDGFEDFNRRVRIPLGFRIRQPARERVFLTESGRAEFLPSPLPDVLPPPGKLMLSTVRSHDQWNTTTCLNFISNSVRI